MLRSVLQKPVWLFAFDFHDYAVILKQSHSGSSNEYEKKKKSIYQDDHSFQI